MTTFDLADVLERKTAKSYGTLGEAFEDLLSDVLYETEDPLPADLAAVAAIWADS